MKALIIAGLMLTTTGCSAFDLIKIDDLGGSSVLYPPQNNLVQWLYDGTASTFPVTDKVGVLSLPTVSTTNSIVQTDHGILNSVTMYLTGSYTSYSYDGMSNSKPQYVSGGGGVHVRAVVDGSWEKHQGAIQLTANPSTTTFPPESGWTSHYPGGIGFPTLSYSSLWVNSDAFVSHDYAELIDHTNGVNGVFVKINSDDKITDILTYSGGFSVGGWNIFDLWMNIPTDSGPIVELEYDADGSIQINADGSVELVLP